MKIVITGTEGIGSALYDAFKNEHEVSMISRRTGHDIKNVSLWGDNFINYDMLINNAYDGFHQVDVLNYFYNIWQNDPNKKIINIGSRCITYKRSDHPAVWTYRQHKQALQTAVDSMMSTAKCDIKIINPGVVDTKMSSGVNDLKFSTKEIADRIKSYSQDPTLKRIDLWL